MWQQGMRRVGLKITKSLEQTLKQQNTFWHEKIDLDKLKGYVYALVDPKESTVFYIGRAGGNEAQGNKRPDAHLKEAIEYRDNQ